MAKPLALLIAFVLSSGAPTVRQDAQLMASAKMTFEAPAQGQDTAIPPVSETSSDQPATPFPDEESKAELQLLVLANQSRQQAGAPPLTLDPGLTKAALLHAKLMLDARQLSHQFDGEPMLPERLAVATRLQLDESGENVAFDFDAERGHQHLMLSPPHRANLLNPSYNVVGMGVIRSGDRLYIVQDFGRALPSFTLAQAKGAIGTAVNQFRRTARMPDLVRRDLADADSAACSMAQADKLGTPAVRSIAMHYTVISFTSLRPDSLPNGADQAIQLRNLRGFSVGACYTRTATYPTGAYWIVLSLE